MSDTEEPDFDLNKLARRLSISSDDWHSDTSSQGYNWGQDDARPGSLQSQHTRHAPAVSHPTWTPSDLSAAANAERRDLPQEPSLAASSQDLATSFPFLTSVNTPETSANTSSVTPRASSSKQGLAGLGLSDASWSQALASVDASSKGAGDSKLIYSSPFVPLAAGSHVESLVDPPGSCFGSTARVKPKLTTRRTIGGTSGEDRLSHSTGSSASSPPQYALYMPFADGDDPASHLKEKRKSLRSSIVWDDSSDPLSPPADPRRRSMTRSPSLNASQTSHSSSSPRFGMRSPSLSQRPSLSRGPSSSSYTRERSGSVNRRVSGQHSRSSSRASIHMPGASPVVSRRISSHRSASTYVKGKALSLKPPELLEVLKEEHHRMFDPSGSSTESLRKTRPLVIDTRPLPEYNGPAGRIKGSINCNFPSLLIKRFKKGKIANFMLESFITTDAGKRLFQHVTTTVQNEHSSPEVASTSDPVASTPSRSSKALANLDIFVVDENIPELDGSSTGSILVSVLEQVVEGQVGRGSICYLHGAFDALTALPAAAEWIVHGEGHESDGLQNHGGHGPADGDRSETPPNTKQLHIRSPPRVSSATALQPIARSAPESPERTPGRKPSRTQLKRLDTGETTREFSNKPQHMGLRSASPASRLDSDSVGTTSRPDSRGSIMSLQELCRQQASSPRSTAFDSSITSRTSSPARTARAGNVLEPRASSPVPPGTAREEGSEFLISTVIPGFIYLGPEPQTREDIEQLKDLGVKQILNMALEIEEGVLVGHFEKYVRIPMRDFVDETGVQDRIDEACALLDDADLKSKSVYVHCRAGKSRSVTIVLAYLIHRYHWTLARAYEHVSEKRKGISPNIGFMSELMRFEERELGTKTSGVTMASSLPTSGPSNKAQGSSQRGASSISGTSNAPGSASAHTAWSRMRDSMPPMNASPTNIGHFSGDREQEVKGYNGAWVHARRDQMSERFQPNRRASKAGLESN